MRTLHALRISKAFVQGETSDRHGLGPWVHNRPDTKVRAAFPGWGARQTLTALLPVLWPHSPGAPRPALGWPDPPRAPALPCQPPLQAELPLRL